MEIKEHVKFKSNLRDFVKKDFSFLTPKICDTIFFLSMVNGVEEGDFIWNTFIKTR